jgi:hypothetical protein
MAARGQLALQRQLQREIKHMAWLEANMAGSALLERCKLRIEQLEISLGDHPRNDAYS